MRKVGHKAGAGVLAGLAGRAAAFTLVEVIIAIGAVAVVSVGLAAIFQTVGKTVTQGQKVSVLTQYAATLEQQLRRDFSSITREGFLVIRNQFAGPRNGGNPWVVGINKDDSNPRERRVDELLFFIKGEFESGRAPVNPLLVARGGSAMVWYGHGQKPRHRDPDGDGIALPADVRPSVSSLNDPDPSRATDVPGGRNDLFAFGGGGALGESLAGGFALPNTYAEGWNLLRKQTVLCKPKHAREDQPQRGWPPVLRQQAGPLQVTSRLSENAVQIAAQPAASSIFRSLARVVSVVAPGTIPPNASLVRTTGGQGADPGAGFPQLSSGLVDIATTDLGEVRTIVQTFAVDPWSPNLLTAYNSPNYSDPGNLSNPNWPARLASGVNRMHAWMEDALPTQSDRFGRNDPTDPRAARVRYEEAPPDYLNVLSDLQGSGGEAGLALIERRADQAMLAQGVVLPRCTEFMVEWSFGDSTMVNGAAADLGWFGTTTPSNLNFTQYSSGGIYSHNPFANRDNALAKAVSLGAAYSVSGTLIYGDPIPSPDMTQTAHFGYFDPNYSPLNGGSVDPLKPTVVPWAWPKLVRITVAMVDERDPLKEERFQWVFELPGTPDPQ